ncbi:MAG TPA: hypothetical protein VL088_15725 [Pedobacter sp.]|nr:hypothetical protein [Pedobacter sp.]
MKKLLFFLLLTPISLFAQTDNIQDSIPGTSIILKNNEVIFSKVYESEFDKDILVEKLSVFISGISNLEYNFNTSNPYQLNGNLNGNTVNYRKYGGTLMGTNILLNYPIYANVVIQIKDNRYRVLVSNMNYKNVPNAMSHNNVDYLLDDLVTRKKRTSFRTASESIRVLEYIDRHLSDIFDLNVQNVIDDDF